MKKNFKGSVMLNPTPVVIVTSKYEDKVNAFTVGWVSTVCTKEPIIAMGIRPERLSHDYIKNSGECVINLPNKDMVKFVDYCGVASGRKTDKINDYGYELNDGVSISTPSIDSSPVALECKVKSITPLGTHDLFLLEVVNVKVDEAIIDKKGKICFNKANLICYSHGEYFEVNPTPLGSFGYSVRKKKTTNESSKASNNNLSEGSKKDSNTKKTNKLKKNYKSNNKDNKFKKNIKSEKKDNNKKDIIVKTNSSNIDTKTIKDKNFEGTTKSQKDYRPKENKKKSTYKANKNKR